MRVVAVNKAMQSLLLLLTAQHVARVLHAYQ